MKLSRQHRVALYRLKRDFGSPMVVRRIISNTINRGTGGISESFTDYPIKLGIILPTKRTYAFEHDQAYMGGGRNFTYGGIYDPNKVDIIIDTRDLPFILTKDDKLVIGNKVADIDVLTVFEPMASYSLTAKYIENIQ